MASATTVRHPKGPPEAESGSSAGGFVKAFLDSSVGAKLTVAITGICLTLFVIAHLIGNLKLLQGPEAINHYAYFLKHDLGVLIWIARAGLLSVFVLHLVLALRLQYRARAARPIAYSHARSVQARVSSRTMVWSGILVGIFILYHLAHFTFGWLDPAYLELKDAKGQHDVYRMMVAGFSNPVIATIYLVAQVILFMHLRHGIPSTFQTLGVKSAKWVEGIDLLGLAVAIGIFFGNSAIVLLVWGGVVR